MSHAAAAQLDWFGRFVGVRGIIVSEWIKSGQGGLLKVLVKTLRGECAGRRAGEGAAVLFQRANKEDNLS